MESMKAAVLTAFGGAESFEIQTVPKPVPKPDQVLVRVCATSINVTSGINWPKRTTYA